MHMIKIKEKIKMEEESMKRNMTISRKIAVGALSVVVGVQRSYRKSAVCQHRVCRDRGEV